MSTQLPNQLPGKDAVDKFMGMPTGRITHQDTAPADRREPVANGTLPPKHDTSAMVWVVWAAIGVAILFGIVLAIAADNERDTRPWPEKSEQSVAFQHPWVTGFVLGVNALVVGSVVVIGFACLDIARYTRIAAHNAYLTVGNTARPPA